MSNPGFFKRIFGPKPVFSADSEVAVTVSEYDGSFTSTEEQQQDNVVTIAAPVISSNHTLIEDDGFVEVSAVEDTYAEPGQAVVIEEERRVIAMLGGDRPQTRTLSPQDCIIMIIATLLDRVPKITSISRDVFWEGLSILDDCCVFFSTGGETKKLVETLEGLDAFFKLYLVQALGVILENPKWPTAAPNQDFEIAPVVWALLRGPVGIAAGFIQGDLIFKILLEAEENWVAAKIDQPDFDSKKAELQSLAVDVCAWADGVLNPITAATTVQRKVAKVSTVKVVGNRED